jgi:hypothetical protein
MSKYNHIHSIPIEEVPKEDYYIAHQKIEKKI